MLNLSGPLNASQFQHPLAEFQVDVYKLAPELVRHGLQGGSLTRRRRTYKDHEPEILARRLLDRLLKFFYRIGHDSALPLASLASARAPPINSTLVKD